MLEIYIQEVAADDLLRTLSPSVLDKARLFADGAYWLLLDFVP